MGYVLSTDKPLQQKENDICNKVCMHKGSTKAHTAVQFGKRTKN